MELKEIEKAMEEVFKDFNRYDNQEDNTDWCGCWEGDVRDEYEGTRNNFIKRVLEKLKCYQEEEKK